ncbi:MAG: ABC transporter permease [Williamsia sp.]|nr:ABC transporter permease [Williamsia sp.]
MLKNYLKTALRSLRKNKLYTVINVFGLAAGLAACLLIGLYIIHELGYDGFHANGNRIVRATMEYGREGTNNTTATTGTKVGPQFKRVFPVVQEYVRTFISHSTVKAGEQLFDEPRILYADDPFFRVFSFPLIQGDAATALDAPDKIVLTQSMARKYFGAKEALNQTITCSGKELKVSAICEDVPQNSQLKFDFVTQFLNLRGVKDETWWTANWITYFLLRDEKDLSQFQQQVTAYMKTGQVRADAGLSGSDFLTYHLEPLKRVHLYSSLPGFEPNGSITYIYMFALVALLILVIACANYTNLATAQSAGRTGEIGMRKVMGASKGAVFMQFMGESFLLTLFAAITAFAASILLIPAFNHITGRQFTAAALLQPWPILIVLVCSLIVGFFAGLYPALVLSGAQVMGVLKKGFAFTGGNNLLRKTLIVAQFGISVFLIIYTVIILQQLHYLQTKNLGYDKDHVVVLPIGGKMMESFQSLKEAFAQVPGVEGITASYETPEFVEWGDGITAMDEKGKHDVSLNAMPVDLDFIRTMKMQLVAGRDFQEADFALMDTSNKSANYHLPYIINETLAKTIGWTPQQAINRTIENRAAGPVVGVVKDFNFSSLHDPIGPLLIFLGRDLSRDFMIRIKGSNTAGTLSALEAVWKQRIPERPFNYHFLDEDYDRLYLAEQRTSRLFTVAATLAIVLACLGLFGLAAFTALQRTKEIGIRRVLGADVGSIVFLIAGGFLRLIGIAILMAVPLAWWAGNKWLQDFAFRIPVQVFPFVLIAGTTLLLALCTVGYHSVRVAFMNPVKSLRTE